MIDITFQSSEDNSELLHVIDAVAKEKSISREVIVEIMERSICFAAKKKYGNNENIKTEINRKTGEIRVFRDLEVVENVENTSLQISLENANKKYANSKLGDIIQENLPPVEIKRGVAQLVKGVLTTEIKFAEKDREYEEFSDKVGEILNGTIKSMDKGQIIVDINKSECLLKKDQLIKGDVFKSGDRIKVYLKSLVKNNTGPQIILSRSDPKFLYKLMELEIPEIYDRLVEVKSIARDPGSKSKVAVISRDMSVDATGCCVGVRGSRIKNISNELNGEKIDIVLWSEDIVQYTINALNPAQIRKVILNNDRKSIEVITSKDQLSIAIGKGGQNIILASRLIGRKIEVMTDEEESKKRTEEFNSTSSMFIEKLDIDEIMAQLLTASGYSSVEEISSASLSSLAKIEGFDEELAEALQERANECLSIKDS